MRRLLVATLLLIALLPRAFSVAAQEEELFADFDFLFLVGEATSNPSIAGPLSGELAIESGTTYIEPAGVHVRDFYAYAEFTNPYPASQHLFDIGLSFRKTGRDEDFRLVIDSLGDWYFKQAGPPDTVSGEVPELRTGAGETNAIDFVASGDTGYFAVNGEFVGTLDLSARPVKGDVAVGTGYYAEDQLAGQRTPFAQFEVWSLDEALPTGAEAEANLRQRMSDARSSGNAEAPLAGEVPHETGSVNGISAGGEHRDFYAHAEFTNPYPASEHLGDIGFGVRDSGDDELRVAVDSEGTWRLSRGAAPILEIGSGALLNTGAGERNTVDLVAVGGVGYLAVNDRYVATLDLGVLETSGEVWAGSGFYAENKIDGAMTSFNDFQVWSLDSAPSDEGQEGISLVGDGEVFFDLLPHEGTGFSGVGFVAEAGAQSYVELAVFEATGEELVAIYGGSCASLMDVPAFELAPIDPVSLKSVTDVAFPYEYLTTGEFAVAIHAADPAQSLIACGRIPPP